MHDVCVCLLMIDRGNLQWTSIYIQSTPAMKNKTSFYAFVKQILPTAQCCVNPAGLTHLTFY